MYLHSTKRLLQRIGLKMIEILHKEASVIIIKIAAAVAATSLASSV